MLCIDHTLDTVAENLALDESLLLQADARPHGQEVLRLWDARQIFVVLGRGSRLREEVHLEQTTRDRVPVHRRVSGGASIVAAPGCMFYTALLSLDQRPHLRMIDEAHQFVMSRILQAIRQLVPAASLDGTCDVVLGDRKVSGNSLRVGRGWLLYHGSLLRTMELGLVERYLKHPPREPDYRQQRPHQDFLANLEVDRDALAAALKDAWRAGPTTSGTLHFEQTVSELVRDKYSQDSWTASR